MKVFVEGALFMLIYGGWFFIALAVMVFASRRRRKGVAFVGYGMLAGVFLFMQKGCQVVIGKASRELGSGPVGEYFDRVLVVMIVGVVLWTLFLACYKDVKDE